MSMGDAGSLVPEPSKLCPTRSCKPVSLYGQDLLVESPGKINACGEATVQAKDPQKRVAVRRTNRHA
uniref:Uncharacterized protein n=1 Tax=Salmonella phage PMBT18 TaxID=3229742 RepID=A0AB39C0V3_9CAUD